MIYLITEYLKFLTKSSNQHGVHSPFVYDLVTKCFYKKTDAILVKLFSKNKQQLLDNKTFIKVTDFGAGSKIFKNNNRQVSKIAKIAGLSNKKAKLLIRIIQYFKPKNILEIGTSLGLGTSAFKIGNINSIITTLEGCPETSKVADNLFSKNNYNDIKIITGDFKKTLPIAIKNQQFDCIYFDGNHTKKDTLHYFNACLETITNNSVWIFDDIYWSDEMKEAWIEIKNHKKVTVTVDVFYWGIVFFRKEQKKEHFKIRV
ncbi:class I SAM-dependent methyltransferase [Polaribacter sp. Z014]|uniref:O-methyltransferase n=1 Tax=unclassified Polaribacter TaxID=196858 RepID=UPI00193B3562|nr:MULTISPECIES: class I SAM-dependent methyltransferase [unclassified Polaribacter]MCL7763437.1 class I SAM-dependent methyltransferase [Polaribacter sp. Z014]QVY66783.1 class I SAM-dependent methyltransferase [Polaribacter sp. Q13]